MTLTRDIFLEYNKQLKEKKMIDFNDMINKARKLIEEDKIQRNYSYIIIDEYQDISMSRYKLIKAIKDKSQAKLFCVGDDWQSIYRFAGSDLDLFTSFEEYFGPTQIMKIENTYRNSQELIDMAGKFVMGNPNQLKKSLKSSKRQTNPLRILSYQKNPAQAIKKAIEEIINNFGHEAEITCNFCLGFMVERSGENGSFYGCTNYPRCKNTFEAYW